MAHPNFVSAPLFGGAMRVDLPADFSDMSNLRQIPDHQEVYASNTTRTNIIIEITERVESSDWDPVNSVSNYANPGNANQVLDDDAKAVLHHLNDVCEVNDDTFTLIDQPQQHPISKIAAPTWTVQARVATKTRVTRETAGGGVQTVMQDTTGTIHLFVVRLVAQKADILVHVNVPHEELERAGDPSVAVAEELKAHQILARMMGTLEIVDYGLFGADGA